MPKATLGRFTEKNLRFVKNVKSGLIKNGKSYHDLAIRGGTSPKTVYELVLSKTEYEAFKQKVRLVMLKRGITMRDLSKKTGYSLGTLYGFFAGKNSRFVAAAIAEVLEI